MGNKITLNEIVAKKRQGEMDKFTVTSYKSEVLGGEIEVKKIPIRKFMELQEVAEDDHMEGIGLTLFECLPLFRDMPEDVMDTYGVNTSTDLVFAVFEENMGEMIEIMEEINKLYGIKEKETLSDKVVEEIKN